MKIITCYFDFISPYAFLAFRMLPSSLAGIKHKVVYKPLLFAGLLKFHGQLGPAEIPSKRDWTYRQVMWQAHQLAVPLEVPAAHPFNPLPLLRLAVASDAHGNPNRETCDAIFTHVWQGGAAADDARRLSKLTSTVNPVRSPDSADVKAALQAHGREALQHGVFGVPAFVVDGKLFWGLDSLPMLRAYLSGDPWFDARWGSKIAEGVQRPRS